MAYLIACCPTIAHSSPHFTSNTHWPIFSISHAPTHTYHPQTNSQPERYNSSLIPSTAPLHPRAQGKLRHLRADPHVRLQHPSPLVYQVYTNGASHLETTLQSTPIPCRSYVGRLTLRRIVQDRTTYAPTKPPGTHQGEHATQGRFVKKVPRERSKDAFQRTCRRPNVRPVAF